MGKRIKTVPGIKREREAGLIINKLHLLIMSTHPHNLNYNSYRKKHSQKHSNHFLNKINYQTKLFNKR